MDGPRYQRFDRRAAGLAAAGRSHRGRRRGANEDAFLCEPDRGLFAVIDGMGGMRAGQVASGIARQVLAEADGDDLRRHLDRANRQIFERSHGNPDEEGMGCVATVVRVAGGRLEVAHVGDTRALLASRTGCEQLTRDHTVVADLEESLAMTEADASQLEGRHRVTRDLGGALHDGLGWIDRLESVRFDPGDLLLLCSDGLSDLVSDGELFGWLDKARTQGSDVTELGDELIERALDRGAPDDVTVVLVRRDVLESSTGTEIIRARPELGAARHGGPSHGAAQSKKRRRGGGGGGGGGGGRGIGNRSTPRPEAAPPGLRRPGVVVLAVLAALLFTLLGLGLGLYAPARVIPWLGGSPGPGAEEPAVSLSPSTPAGQPDPSATAAGPDLRHGLTTEVAAGTVLVWTGTELTAEGHGGSPSWVIELGEGSVLVLRRVDLGDPAWTLRGTLGADARLLLDGCVGTLGELELWGADSARVEIRGEGLKPVEGWTPTPGPSSGPTLVWPAASLDQSRETAVGTADGTARGADDRRTPPESPPESPPTAPPRAIPDTAPDTVPDTASDTVPDTASDTAPSTPPGPAAETAGAPTGADTTEADATGAEATGADATGADTGARDPTTPPPPPPSGGEARETP